jgi:hypothetical protein
MHTALNFQQEGQIIVQEHNNRCLCSPSRIIIQVRPEKSIKINSNKKNALLRPPETQSEQIQEQKLCQTLIYFATKINMWNRNIITNATSCKPE